MNWFQKNFKTIIYIAFLVPILTVAFVSISHVTKWYGISNPFSWAIYLSVGIEIAALSALAAISAQMGRKVYFPFGIVTLIQFLGNIYFAYQFIDITAKAFTDWVELVSPLVSYLGIEEGDMIGHKRFLALFAGGMLPIISLSFLHMLVKFEEEDKKKIKEQPNSLPIPTFDIDEISLKAGKIEANSDKPEHIPTEEELSSLERILKEIDNKKFRKETQENDVVPTPEEVIEEPEVVQVQEEVIEEPEVVPTPEEVIEEPEVVPTPEEVIEEPEVVQVQEEVVEEPVISTPEEIIEEPKINTLYYTKKND